MKKKIIWLLGSCLMVAALVLASCGPAEEEEEVVPPPAEEEEEVTPPAEEEEVAPGAEMVKLSLKKLDGTAVEKMVEKPRYGGQLIQGVAAGYEPLNFDPVVNHVWFSMNHFVNEATFGGDYARGPSGTGESSFTAHYLFPPPGILTGFLAESWERPEADTIILHIRKGVRFQNKPPVNGREFTADDLVYNFLRYWEHPKGFYRGVIPWDTHVISMTATDKYTVIIECQPGKLAMVYEYALGQWTMIARELVESETIDDWRQANGTGPFMLKDWVKGSSLTWERNPNYWRKHPLFPEDTLPYLDGIKWLIIPDFSTQLSALRTGKIDHLFADWEQAEALTKTNPELNYLRWHTGIAATFFFPMDKPELPFSDIRVRRALSMAVDNQAILNDFYNGNAELITLPAAPFPEFADIRTELEDLPEETRKLFGYHPEEAKQLLAEAGYPDGFQTEIMLHAAYADLAAIVIDYWAKVGVDAKLNVKEVGAFYAARYGHAFPEICIEGAGAAYPYTFYWWTPGSQDNISGSNDARIVEAKAMVEANYFDEPKKKQAMRDIIPYMLGQAYELQTPGAYSYTFWQPWVKGYGGEWQVAYGKPDWGIYVWLDQDLKEEMTGKR